MKIRPFEYYFRSPYHSPEVRNRQPVQYRRTVENGMIIERDVPVMMRDGVRIYVDIFRPADEQPAAPIISWSPYGKHVTTAEVMRLYPNSGVENTSPYTAFEAPDPLLWVPKGYAIIVADMRGTWYSEGTATYVSPKEAEDYYDLIEWAGTQSWSNGKVGLSGVSYLTVSQWRVAELNPPHLVAINPYEGWTDTYREVVRHGGIPETSFWPRLIRRWGASTTRIEDLYRHTLENQFYDEYWASKSADLSKITVPAYIVASWSDHGLHSRGTLEGYKKIASQQKWLEVHGRKKWAYYYDPANVKRQQEFFDHFLHDRKTSISTWPKVRLELREKLNVGSMIEEKEWPIARTQYTKLYLDAHTGTLNKEPVAKKASIIYNASEESWGYDALGQGLAPHRAQFDYTFDQPTNLIGHMKLKVYMEARGSDDMDVFVGIQKLDAQGEIVSFIHYIGFEDGPVALGWIRASHRELDELNSTEFQPILKHQRELKLTEGEIVPLEIEIWPSGTRFEAGETLRLIVQGTDINQYPESYIYIRHDGHSVNKGQHIIHTGGGYDSYLLIPVVPEKGSH